MSFASVLLAAVLSQSGAPEAHERALRSLEAGDAIAAESAAREALAESLRFTPEEEIEARPDKGILFEEMILEARKSYRVKRARYFRTLGDALAAQERYRASRYAYQRSAAMAPDSELYALMADDPDLTPEEQVDFLLEAYLAPGADRSRLEEALLATKSFRSRNALKASLDRKRFSELSAEFPDLERLDRAFPSFQAVTDAGNLNTPELFRQGQRLVVYFPEGACASCSEQLDGLTRPVLEAKRRRVPITLAAFVPESDLPGARRIVRLLGLELGVGRLEDFPEQDGVLENGEIRVIARGGLTQIRMAMTRDIRATDIRRRVEAVFSFLDAPGLPTEEEPEEASVPLVTLEEGTSDRRTFDEWVSALVRLEAGPAPLDDFYDRLRRLTLRLVRAGNDRGLALDLLAALGRLDGAGGAKETALNAAGVDVGDRLLERARAADPEVRRSASPGEGAFFASVTEGEPRRVLLQRSFSSGSRLAHFDFVLEDGGADLSIVYAAETAGAPHGVLPFGPDGGVFRYASGEDCRGLRLVTGESVRFESCFGAVVAGELVEVHPALVDAPPGGPTYFRRGVLDADDPSALAEGLRLFEESAFAEAASSFGAALGEVDPEAPYDASAVLYNQARSLELAGQVREALAIYRSLGDVPYQDLVDEGAGRIEGAAR